MPQLKVKNTPINWELISVTPFIAYKAQVEGGTLYLVQKNGDVVLTFAPAK